MHRERVSFRGIQRAKAARRRGLFALHEKLKCDKVNILNLRFCVAKSKFV